MGHTAASGDGVAGAAEVTEATAATKAKMRNLVDMNMSC